MNLQDEKNRLDESVKRRGNRVSERADSAHRRRPSASVWRTPHLDSFAHNDTLTFPRT